MDSPAPVVIGGAFSKKTFAAADSLPEAEGPAELIVHVRSPKDARSSIYDAFGKARQPRTTEALDAQLEEERSPGVSRELCGFRHHYALGHRGSLPADVSTVQCLFSVLRSPYSIPKNLQSRCRSTGAPDSAADRRQRSLPYGWRLTLPPQGCQFMGDATDAPPELLRRIHTQPPKPQHGLRAVRNGRNQANPDGEYSQRRGAVDMH